MRTRVKEKKILLTEPVIFQILFMYNISLNIAQIWPHFLIKLHLLNSLRGCTLSDTEKERHSPCPQDVFTLVGDNTKVIYFLALLFFTGLITTWCIIYLLIYPLSSHSLVLLFCSLLYHQDPGHIVVMKLISVERMKNIKNAKKMKKKYLGMSGGFIEDFSEKYNTQKTSWRVTSFPSHLG